MIGRTFGFMVSLTAPPSVPDNADTAVLLMDVWRGGEKIMGSRFRQVDPHGVAEKRVTIESLP